MSESTSVTLAQAMSVAQSALESVRASDTPSLDVRLIFGQVLGLTMEQLLCRLNEPIESAAQRKADDLLYRRMDHEPMAYILGHKDFYGHTFFVDQRVLIPRPDTETLVEAALTYIRSRQAFYNCTGGTWGDHLKIVDVCTGSGCVGISLAAELPECPVTLTDLSPEALEVAKINAKTILGHDLTYVRGDLLTPFIPAPLDEQREAYKEQLRKDYGWDEDYGYGRSNPDPFRADIKEQFDIIVSNPPYLTAKWCDETEPQVKWEPRSALDGGGFDGLEIIGRLIEQASVILSSGGALLLECDYRQCDSVADSMKQHGFYDICIEKDLAGLPRVVWGIV